MHRQGLEEYVWNNSGVINLELTLGRSTRPENYIGISSTLNEGARRNLADDGRQEVCGSIKANGKSTVSLPLKRNRQFLEGESSSRGAHQAAPSDENDNGNISFKSGAIDHHSVRTIQTPHIGAGSPVINSVFSERNPLPSNGRESLEPFHDREGDHVSNSHFHDQMGRRHVFGPPRTLNTITPCAACRLLRRRCAQECPLSPYFSPHEPQKFASVHKVFGASNVSKMLKEVPKCQRADVANSLVYEANMRLRDPVYGCMGAISALQQRVQSLQAKLNAARADIHKYKLMEANNMNMNMNIPSSISIAAAPPPPTNSSSSSLYIQPRDSTN